MIIDRELIARKLRLIAEDGANLCKLASLSLEGHLKDQRNEDLAERYLERVIGRIIDINNHIIRSRELPPPEDYYKTFTKLCEIGVMTPKLAEVLTPFAGLRNRLTHEYNEIDPTKVYESIKRLLDHLPEYTRAVEGVP